ncbi:archaeal proteasome endopeptidase complex subunit beta [Candidatus Bathyarchaeota archaeon]|nr:archaeal proteasome endopeptidase complex subunit beta [Candidatus Bathyarchaeota archaeon]
MESQQQFTYVPGATTIGVVCTDGLVLASEKRLSYGNLVISRVGKKVFKITDRIGAACAGLISDMQVLVRQVEAYSKLFELDTKRNIPVKSAAKVMSNLLFNRRLIPLITQTLVGGLDEEGTSLYILDILGSVIPDKYAAVGSGAQIAVGVLEEGYKEDINVKEARDLAIRAVKSAISRDTRSGDGVDFLIVTKDGIQEDSLKF